MARRPATGAVVARLGEGDLEAVLRDTLADPDLVVALAPEAGGAWRRPDGDLAPPPADAAAVTELRHDGAVVAVVVHGRSPGRERRLLEAVGPAAALAAVNARLALELEGAVDEARRARASVVAAGDDARRRAERNLHDGAQQRLVATALDAQLVRMDADDPALDAALDRTAGALQAALRDLRRVARGLFPAVLTDHGLPAALAALAADAPVPLHLVTVPEGRFAPEAEAGAWTCVAAALAGAAGPVAVAVVHHGDRLGLRVDGVVLDPDQLVGIEDRVVALGGEVGHERAQARLTAWLPA